MLLLLLTIINHPKTSTTTEDDDEKPNFTNIAPSEFTVSAAQPLIWKQVEEVPIKSLSITIPKEIVTGIHQWDKAEIKKFTS